METPHLADASRGRPASAPAAVTPGFHTGSHGNPEIGRESVQHSFMELLDVTSVPFCRTAPSRQRITIHVRHQVTTEVQMWTTTLDHRPEKRVISTCSTMSRPNDVVRPHLQFVRVKSV
jgi:hypothetical protein